MNKNLKNSLILNYPIISLIILGLIYLYLEFPNNILEQTGGDERSWDYPPNTPYLYKYRFAFAIFPFLLIGVMIYYAYFTHVVVANTNFWSLGHDFFANFQMQYMLASKDPTLAGNINESYELPQNPPPPPDLQKMFNIIKLTGDKTGQAYTKAQFFCNAARPCSCCNDDSYVKYYWPNCRDAATCKEPGYLRLCRPSKSTT